jgi:hypothetical protein
LNIEVPVTVTLAIIKHEVDTAAAIPPRVQALLNDAAGRIESFIEQHIHNPVSGFVPSDYVQVYRALKWIGDRPASHDRTFCEWGSGLGVIACLASMLGFDAVGIEIELRLVQAARQLAADHRVPVQLVQGSYVPDGYAPAEDFDESHVMTLEDGRAAYDELGLDPDDFGVIFAYPWPGEDDVVSNLFDHAAARGALLMTFHGQDGIMLRRKVR